jgi:hypothetical protein
MKMRALITQTEFQRRPIWLPLAAAPNISYDFAARLQLAAV